jgi:porin
MNHTSSLAFLLPSLLLWPLTARAQSTSSAGPDELTKAPPAAEESLVDVRPFELILPRGYLFGERNGLERIGVTPTLTLEVDAAANPVGGRAQGITEASNLGLGLLFDLEKLGGIPHASFLVQMSQRWGNSLSADYIGNLFATQQVFGGETFRVVDAAYQQKLFDDHAEFRLGRIAAGDDFLVCPYDYLFMQNGFDGNPVGIFFDAPGMTGYPDATWGALVKVHPTPQTYIMAGVYNGDPTIRGNTHHGLDLGLSGPAFLICEGGIRLNGLADDTGMFGDYKAGVWFDNSVAAHPSGTYSRKGTSGIYGLFDQVLLPFAGPQCKRGLGVFGSALFSNDPSEVPMPFFCTAGVAALGIIPTRATDSCGFGVVYGHLRADPLNTSGLTQPSAEMRPVLSYELALELTYRFSLRNNAVFFQPDMQYIFHPGGSDRYSDALVLGCQFGVNF